MSCSMGFGELNIPSSRAFWDDCEEDEFGNAIESKLEPLKLSFETNQPTQPFASDIFLCVEGRDIIAFAEQTLLKHATKICVVHEKKSALYWVAKYKTLIAILEEDLTNSGEVTALLVPYANEAKNVITVNVKPRVDFKTENIATIRDEITFIRGINSNLSQILALEAPNFIAGTAAGVASWRDNKGLPVSSYIAYTDNISLDRMAAQPLLKLLQDLGLNPETAYVPQSKEDSHLYM